MRLPPERGFSFFSPCWAPLFIKVLGGCLVITEATGPRPLSAQDHQLVTTTNMLFRQPNLGKRFARPVLGPLPPSCSGVDLQGFPDQTPRIGGSTLARMQKGTTAWCNTTSPFGARPGFLRIPFHRRRGKLFCPAKPLGTPKRALWVSGPAARPILHTTTTGFSRNFLTPPGRFASAAAGILQCVRNKTSRVIPSVPDGARKMPPPPKPAGPPPGDRQRRAAPFGPM
ncbi:MAG: hypothetical protein CM15mP25_0020 [Gammaproteobacteria bacterium]|nr:MAG: hypothetical protein CM15mP25_0020 [Gammaproteobacteria bacterium]